MMIEEGDGMGWDGFPKRGRHRPDPDNRFAPSDTRDGRVHPPPSPPLPSAACPGLARGEMPTPTPTPRPAAGWVPPATWRTFDQCFPAFCCLFVREPIRRALLCAAPVSVRQTNELPDGDPRAYLFNVEFLFRKTWLHPSHDPSQPSQELASTASSASV